MAPVFSGASETILEVRYRPNPQVLDYRGRWADSIALQMDIPHWSIVDNRVDFFNPEKTQHFFVSFRNAGMSFLDCPTSNFFSDKAQRFMRHLISLEGFRDPVFVERIGVRHRVAKAFPGPMGELVARFANRYMVPSPALQTAMGDAELTDFGAPLHYKDGFGRFNTSAGPMPETQLKQSLRTSGPLPPVSVYVDVDYWDKPQRDMKATEVLAKIAAFSTRSQQRTSAISSIVLA